MYDVFIPWNKDADVWHVAHHIEWIGIKGMKSTWRLSQNIDESGYNTGVIFKFENKDDAIRFKLERR